MKKKNRQLKNRLPRNKIKNNKTAIMKRAFLLISSLFIFLCADAQKKNKSKDKTSTNYAVNDSLPADSIPPPVVKSSKKARLTDKNKNNEVGQGKTTTNFEKKDDKKDSKKGKKDVAVNFKEPDTEPTPVADTSKRFTGIIKYRMTTDDPVD